MKAGSAQADSCRETAAGTVTASHRCRSSASRAGEVAARLDEQWADRLPDLCDDAADRAVGENGVLAVGVWW